MSGPDILTKPWKVSPRSECVYAYAPGEVCIDLTSGKPEDRARVLALLGQVQAGFSLLLEMAGGGSCEGGSLCDTARSGRFAGMVECARCRARSVLRNAGVMSDSSATPEGT